MTNELAQRVEAASGADRIAVLMPNVNCPRDPLTCRCLYHQGYVPDLAALRARQETTND